MTPGNYFTTLHFHHMLQMGPISESFIILDWKGLPLTNTIAYRAHLKVMKKMKCCEYGNRELIQNTSF